MKNPYFIYIIFLITLINSGCNKILDEKPDKNLDLLNNIENIQELLDAVGIINNNGIMTGEGSTDVLYKPAELIDNSDSHSQSNYIWEPLFYHYGGSNSWSYLYANLYPVNLAIEEINKIVPDSNEQDDWNNVLGSALFLRAQIFLEGTFNFCLGYDQSTANKEYGMSLRLFSDFNKRSYRSTLEETYDQIILDLKNSVNLLPNKSISIYRPSKAAAYGLLARTYLSMREYDKALLYSDSCLQIYDQLLDYNTLDLSQLVQFPMDNPEVIFSRSTHTFGITDARVDTTLYQSYDENDLRKYAFYYPLSPGFVFKGTYCGVFTSSFLGVATDEVLLMRAECRARAGNLELAIGDLNKLLVKRWKFGTFVPFEASSKDEVLNLILDERKKELLYRGLRWMDLKRLNLEGRNIILKRYLKGKEYVLEPNSRLYALPLPLDVVDDFGMEQNVY